MVQPLTQKKNVHKRTKHFFRYQSDRFDRVRPNWRKPRGIDSRVRRRFRGTPRMVTIGYGTNKKTRHQLPSGFQKFRVENVQDVELLLMNNRVYAAEIASNVSVLKRKQIIERALQLNVKVINANARLRKEEQQ
mmetsp:Transcript_48644/g.122405  ORF Transcript_48644/g.122405 Transcript_48644/m.122405 type:complete len:134 (-) Transcript_48644:72-473(-)|eukprot:CAMPEP_0177629434 /NCGR_PEP_ID=MMETSP0447-20121125/664_1 /TAXON_ID=0 /ORGANISM="Stygamoeba regulata, Strain BSH-02190019" /LENGTH=133 /DNA_ID=CAMNT_0019130751 /DNA_START=85 /DNA_END=486 /DNA_ORIENTATION=+